MTTLVVGASGATGRLLVEQLLERREHVKIIVRSTENLPDHVTNHQNLSVIHASLLDLSVNEWAKHVSRCDAIASCLGHNLSFKGIFESPRQLVTDATGRLCIAVKVNKPTEPVKFVLMNTAGNRNRDLNEQISFGQNALSVFFVSCSHHMSTTKKQKTICAPKLARTTGASNGQWYVPTI